MKFLWIFMSCHSWKNEYPCSCSYGCVRITDRFMDISKKISGYYGSFLLRYLLFSRLLTWVDHHSSQTPLGGSSALALAKQKRNVSSNCVYSKTDFFENTVRDYQINHNPRLNATFLFFSSIKVTVSKVTTCEYSVSTVFTLYSHGYDQSILVSLRNANQLQDDHTTKTCFEFLASAGWFWFFILERIVAHWLSRTATTWLKYRYHWDCSTWDLVQRCCCWWRISAEYRALRWCSRRSCGPTAGGRPTRRWGRTVRRTSTPLRSRRTLLAMPLAWAGNKHVL